MAQESSITTADAIAQAVQDMRTFFKGRLSVSESASNPRSSFEQNTVRMVDGRTMHQMGYFLEKNPDNHYFVGNATLTTTTTRRKFLGLSRGEGTYTLAIDNLSSGTTPPTLTLSHDGLEIVHFEETPTETQLAELNGRDLRALRRIVRQGPALLINAVKNE